jgi:asparagine synthase (glutamine-hydrolysing)
MCGIFGVLSKEIDLDKCKQSLLTMEYRGPDGDGLYYDESVLLGHLRLSILDLSTHGSQPMQSADSHIIITVNGEIYNHAELRNELEKEYTFNSESDSEVILHGYLKWGAKRLAKKIDGMYAIVIYDKNLGKIFSFRDRVGIKPLYIYKNNLEVSWSSELKAIVNYYDESSLTIDNTASYDFLTYGYIPTPKTYYTEIQKVKPAHIYEIDIETSSISTYRYWELETGEKSRILSLEDEIKNAISKSISEQMVSDVPVGFFLSGGVDSSIVCFEASKYNKDIKTFTIGFDIESKDESKYAEIISSLICSDHTLKRLGEKDYDSIKNKLVTWFDEPFADTSAYPTYYVSKLASEKCKVVLTGDGADELFGGYSWYMDFLKYSKFPKVPKLLSVTTKIKKCNKYFKKIFGGFERYFILEGFPLYTRLMGGLNEYEKKEYKAKYNIPTDYDDYWFYRQFLDLNLNVCKKDLQYLDFHTFLPESVLTKVDRTSMDVSIEARVPFLSKKLIELAFSLKDDDIYYDGKLKGLLKNAYRNDIPNDILYRKKSGFSIPAKDWKLSFLDEKSKFENLLLEFKNIKKHEN